jgi:hypothetical protein
VIVKWCVALCLVLPAAASAQSMNAEAFYRRATALQNRGPLALFSGDLKLLTREGQASGAKAREQRMAAIAAGRKPRYCPNTDVHGMNRNEFLKRLGAIPALERSRIDMLEATNRLLAAKYPCRT